MERCTAELSRATAKTAVLERRAAHLRERIAGRPPANSGFDRQELSALWFALGLARDEVERLRTIAQTELRRLGVEDQR